MCGFRLHMRGRHAFRGDLALAAGAAIVMQITGQTLNLFTIIAAGSAVGLVVDDAIVVVEDVFRRVQGSRPAAGCGATIRQAGAGAGGDFIDLGGGVSAAGILNGLTAALFRRLPWC